MKLMKFLKSSAGRKFYNFAYCWGACLVILGAVFKIAHMPFDSVLLMVGLFTEVFIFFISGFDNPIDILAIGITPDKINFDVEGGDGYLKDGTYYICPDEQRKEVVMHMSCTRDSVYKDLGSQTFKVKSLPTPSPYIILSDNTKYTGNVPIEKERIASTVSIGASISEPVNISYKIIRFEIVLIKNNSKDVLSATSYSPTLTEEQKQILLSAENGDKIYFTDITVKSPKGESVYNLPPVSAPVYE